MLIVTPSLVKLPGGVLLSSVMSAVHSANVMVTSSLGVPFTCIATAISSVNAINSLRFIL